MLLVPGSFFENHCCRLIYASGLLCSVFLPLVRCATFQYWNYVLCLPASTLFFWPTSFHSRLRTIYWDLVHYVGVRGGFLCKDVIEDTLNFSVVICQARGFESRLAVITFETWLWLQFLAGTGALQLPLTTCVQEIWIKRKTPEQRPQTANVIGSHCPGMNKSQEYEVATFQTMVERAP